MPVVAETPTSPADGAPIRPANAPPAPLAERLRRLRTARGWTLAQAAKACAVARSTLSKIENAQMSPTYELLLKLADGFGLGIGELLAADDAGPAHGGGRRSLARPGSGDGS
ncbi:MAG TPA: helix-turn-helix transcriptional regulator, partial [Plasticicumulans sp.]|nr:helix-turn-helix transcriptional regulator [Plasticicumulans sp.]